MYQNPISAKKRASPTGEVLATFCAACANQYAYATNWRRHFRQSLELASLTDHLHLMVCDRCAGEMPQAGGRVTVQLMIAQIDARKDEPVDTDITPTYVDDVLQFCPACGNKVNITMLQRAVDKYLAEDTAGTGD